MTYQKELYKRINDSGKWPRFESPDFLTDLNNLADTAYSKRTIEGYLAALLIYHQLCEEMIKILIQCSGFFVQCAIFPNEITECDLDKKRMFGQLLDELKKGIVNSRIHQLIKKCEELNELRIKMVHKITLKTSITDILLQSKKAQKLFDEISGIFTAEYDNYRATFHECKKNSGDWL